MKRFVTALVAVALVGGCAPATPVLGLRPDAPRAKGMTFVEVESLRPTLQWQGFPQPRDRESDTRLAGARDVAYDLRVWRAGPGDYPADLVYAKDALPEARHTVEEELQPDTHYRWTVRARFSLDGRTRITPWSTLAWPGDVGRVVVPDVAYFRFKTPAR